MAQARHDFYQTNAAVVVSVYVRGLTADDVRVEVSDDVRQAWVY